MVSLNILVLIQVISLSYMKTNSDVVPIEAKLHRRDYMKEMTWLKRVDVAIHMIKVLFQFIIWWLLFWFLIHAIIVDDKKLQFLKQTSSFGSKLYPKGKERGGDIYCQTSLVKRVAHWWKGYVKRESKWQENSCCDKESTHYFWATWLEKLMSWNNYGNITYFRSIFPVASSLTHTHIRVI